MTPPVTVLVPTRNEGENVTTLLHALSDVLLTGDEVIFVDDSDDETPALVHSGGERVAYPVHLIHREGAQRTGGLGGAVLAGMHFIKMSTPDPKGDRLVVVMDGDGQHPVETIHCLRIRAALAGDDLVVASRYAPTSDPDAAAGLDGVQRRFVSKAATTLVRTLFRQRLAGVTDPMTGFFAVRLSALTLDRLTPQGFKILLEILVRNPAVLKVSEVPFKFGTREYGQSKASLAEGRRFLSHLTSLLLVKRSNRGVIFAGIGATGILVNLALTALLLVLPGARGHYLLTSIVATQAAIGWNFLLIEKIFRSRARHSAGRRTATFFGVANLDWIVRAPAMILLVDALSVPVLPAVFLSLALAFVLRFWVMDRLYSGISRVAIHPHLPAQTASVLVSAPVLEKESA